MLEVVSSLLGNARLNIAKSALLPTLFTFVYNRTCFYHFRYNWGRGGQVMTLPIKEEDEQEQTNTLHSWHQVAVVKNGADTTLVVDRESRTLRSNGNHKKGQNGLQKSQNEKGRVSSQYGPRKDSDSLAFGDLHSNGYVFVGGLPSWYAEKLDSVVLPTTLLEPRLRGSVRSLKYRDMRSSSQRKQEMMAYKVIKHFVMY